MIKNQLSFQITKNKKNRLIYLYINKKIEITI